MKTKTSYQALIIFAIVVSTSCNRMPSELSGLEYSVTTGKSPTQKTISFIYKHNGETYRGPSVTGTRLFVRFKDIDGDNNKDIVVKSKTYSSYIAKIKLNKSINTTKDLAFKIIERNGISINYPQAGLVWP